MLGIFLDRITHAVVAFLLSDFMIPLYRELSQGSLLFSILSPTLEERSNVPALGFLLGSGCHRKTSKTLAWKVVPSATRDQLCQRHPFRPDSPSLE